MAKSIMDRILETRQGGSGGDSVTAKILAGVGRRSFGQRMKRRALGVAAVLGDILDRPGAAVRNVIEGVVEEDLQTGLEEAAKNLLPEAITGEPRDPALGRTILEKAGVGELGTMNLPVLGEVTGRGALGLLIDVGADPAMLVPGAAITKGFGKAGTGISKAVAKAAELVPEAVKVKAAAGMEAIRPALQKTFNVGLNPDLVKMRQEADAMASKIQQGIAARVLDAVRKTVDRGISEEEAKLLVPLAEYPPSLRSKLIANPNVEQAQAFQEFMTKFVQAVPDPHKRQVIEDAANDLEKYFDDIKRSERAAGIETPELGGGLVEKKLKLERELEQATELLDRRKGNVTRSMMQRIRAAETGLDRLVRAQERTAKAGGKAETSLAIAQANIELDDFRKAVMEVEMVPRFMTQGPLAKKLFDVFTDVESGVQKAFSGSISKAEDLEAALVTARKNQSFQFAIGTLRQSLAQKGGPVVDKVTKRLKDAFEGTRRKIVDELARPIEGARDLTDKTTRLMQLEMRFQKETVKDVVGMFDQKRMEILRSLNSPVKSLEELSTKIENIKKLEIGPQERLVDRLRSNLAERIGKMDASGQKRLSNIQAKMAGVDQAIEFLPSYVTHVATPEAIEALIARGPGFASKLRNPTHASLLMRKWIDAEGRPFSLIEIDDIIQRRAQKAGSEKLAKFAEGEQRYFEVDPAAVMFVRGKRYARAVSGKQFLDEAGMLFGESVPEELLAAAKTKTERDLITKRWVREQVDQGAYAVEQPYLKGTVFKDPAVAAEIDRLYQGFVNEEVTNKVLQVFDAAQGYFKRNVLFLAPAYFTRNLLGGIWNTFLSSGNPASMVESYKDALDVLRHAPNKQIRIGGARFSGKELYDAWAETGALTVSQYILESPRTITAEVQQIMRAGRGRRPTFRGRVAKAIRPGGAVEGSLAAQARSGLSQAVETGTLNPLAGGLNPFRVAVGMKPYDAHFAVIRAGQEFAQFSDELNRLATGLEMLKQGLASGLPRGQAIQEASQGILKFQFDFSRNSFTQFENQVMRRIFPFYAWTRKNVPLQLWAALHTPGRFGLPSKLVRGSNTILDEDILPEYILEGTPIRAVDDEQGNPQFLYGLGLPLEDLNRVMLRGAVPDMRRTLERIGSDVNPFARAIIEQWTGRNLYFGQDVVEVNQAPAALRFLPAPVKSIIGFRERADRGKASYTMSPIWLNYWMNDPTGFSRFLISVSKLTDPRKALASRVMNALTGGKLKSIDKEAEMIRRENETLTRLGRELRLQGEPLREHTRLYVPKGSAATPQTQELLNRLKQLEKRRKELQR
mgnify:CR=1 FL=1